MLIYTLLIQMSRGNWDCQTFFTLIRDDPIFLHEKQLMQPENAGHKDE